MIQLSRDRAAVPTAFLEPGCRANLLELYRAARDNQLDLKAVKDKLFSSSRWGIAKQQLAVESAGKCAFCESPTSAAYYGDVEHFRPKAIYWWLAYCYDNYLYSCRICNGKKSDKHLLSGKTAAGPVVLPDMNDTSLLALAATASPQPGDVERITALAAQLLGESPWLPHPYDEDGETIFTWKEDEVLREVRIAARPGTARAALALQAVEQILDLNRSELLTARWQVYTQMKRLNDLAGLGDAVVRAIAITGIKEAMNGRYPYSGMVRYYGRERWNLI
ncbi:hypothetical protein [Mesorhizobium sp. M0847]|uniref:hypothetical protein n=1 Tax=unclassified Mesorhizobium TaxID=325217 RepID=UPI00333BC987